MLARMSPVVRSLFGCSHQGSERTLHYVVMPGSDWGSFFSLVRRMICVKGQKTPDPSEFLCTRRSEVGSKVVSLPYPPRLCEEQRFTFQGLAAASHPGADSR